jgi:hypothetical protein
LGVLEVRDEPAVGVWRLINQRVQGVRLLGFLLLVCQLHRAQRFYFYRSYLVVLVEHRQHRRLHLRLLQFFLDFFSLGFGHFYVLHFLVQGRGSHGVVGAFFQLKIATMLFFLVLLLLAFLLLAVPLARLLLAFLHDLAERVVYLAYFMKLEAVSKLRMHLFLNVLALLVEQLTLSY